MRSEAYTTNEVFGLELNNSRFLLLDDLIPWFASEYKIHELVNEFWGLHCKSRLVAVTKDIKDQSWKGLVSEWDTSTSLAGQFRVNKPLIEGLLKYSLGDDDRMFKLQNISSLELSIFENFFVELENFWKDYWRVVIPNSNGTYIYLVWAVELDGEEIGSLAIGVPPGLGPKNYKEKSKIDFKGIASNLDIEVPLDLTVGKSKLKISDIRSLEEEDLIIFENSDTNYLTWKKSDLEKLWINIEIPGKDNPRFSNLFYDDLETAEMAEENSHGEDLLTDLPVELTAQFKSVQMPLHKIIELESGGILPLGLLMDSQLTLVAPGDKAIASGNLVIVGNQFGIKINKTNIKKAVAAKLNYSAIESSVAPTARRAAPNVQEQYADSGFGNTEEQDLDQELEDIGLDPKELDELEDLY